MDSGRIIAIHWMMAYFDDDDDDDDDDVPLFLSLRSFVHIASASFALTLKRNTTQHSKPALSIVRLADLHVSPFISVIYPLYSIVSFYFIFMSYLIVELRRRERER